MDFIKQTIDEGKNVTLIGAAKAVKTTESYALKNIPSTTTVTVEDVSEIRVPDSVSLRLIGVPDSVELTVGESTTFGVLTRDQEYCYAFNHGHRGGVTSFASASAIHGTKRLGDFFDSDINDVVAKKFVDDNGVVELQPDMTDEMLLICIKHAISMSNGKPFLVVPSGS